MGSPVARVVRALLVAALLVLVGASAASAHATLLRSDPPNGGMVATGRTTLTLWYGEAITPAVSSFDLRGGSAATPVPVQVRVDGDGRVVHLTVPPLERGTYTLTWATVATDGHPTRGEVLFGSGFRPDGLPSDGAALPAPWPVLLRTADLGGTLLALGALLALWRVVPALGALAPVTRRRTTTAGLVGLALALASSLATPVVMTASQLGPDAGAGAWRAALGDIVLASTWGRLWLVRVAVLVVAVTALWLSRSRVGRRRAVAGAALVVGVALDAWAGHASALPSGRGPAWAAATAHVLAAGAWAGGLLVLALVLRPLAALDRGDRGAPAMAAWRAYSPLAALSSLVLVASGTYEAGVHVEAANGLLRGVYGPAVLAKVVVVGVALCLAAYNTVLVNERVAERVGRVALLGRGWRPARHALRTTALVEALVLALAVVLAAVMTSVPTAREVSAAASASAPQSDRADGLFVTVESVPTGRDLRVLVRAQAVVRPLGTPVTGVEIGLTEGTVTAPASRPEDRLVLTAVEPGRWEGQLRAPATTDWTTEVFLRRAGARTTVVLTPWSSAPPASTFGTAATGVALALLLVAGTAVVVARRRRRPGAPTELPLPTPGERVLEEVGR